MSCLSQTAVLIRTGTSNQFIKEDSSQEVMIGLVKYGRLRLVSYCILLKDIKMQYMPWHSISRMGKYLNLFRDKVATGSFDKTAKLWDT